MTGMNFYSNDGASGDTGVDVADPRGSGAEGPRINETAFDQASIPFDGPVIGDQQIGGKIEPRSQAPGKKAMSTGKKVGLGIGGAFFLAAAGLILLDPGPGVAPPKPTQPPAAMQEQPAPAAAATVLAGDGAAPGATLMSDATPATTAPAVEDAAKLDAKSPVVSASQEIKVEQKPPAPVPQPVSVPIPAMVTIDAKGPKKSGNSAVATSTSAPEAGIKPKSEADLNERVAMLERRLARFERQNQGGGRARATGTGTSELDQSRVRAAGRTTAVPLAEAQRLQEKATPPIAPVKPAASTGDSVRVLGLSKRQGISTAVIEFAGVRHRVAVGQAVAGLGVVSTAAFDAAGNPVVEINGVRYE